VEDDCDPFRVVVVDELGDELRREGDEPHEQEHEQVEPIERRVRGPQGTGDGRVLQPDDSDRHEARQIGE
jgi:hypothetical protein